MTVTLVKIELEKLFRRGRTYIGLGAVLLIVMVIQAAMTLDGDVIVDLVSENIKEAFFLQGNLLNGFMISFLSLNGLWVHVPILVVIVTGDLISGEANSGTLRLVLTRPVSRIQLILAKFISAMIYVTLLILILATVSLCMGLFFNGTGDIIVIYDSINILPEEILLGRFMMAFLFGTLGMFLVAGLSLVFSAMFENSLSSIMLTMAIIILFTVISNFGTGIFDELKPFLFTSHISRWQSFFELNLDWKKILVSAYVIAGHIIFFLVLTVIIFKTKDITS